MTPQELLERSLLLLRIILAKVTKTDNDPEAFIKMKATHIWCLADDVLLLEDRNRADSAPILIRAMLETLFKLAAAAKRPKLALESMVEDLEFEAKHMKDPQMSARAADLRKLHQLSPRKGKRMEIKQWAKDAGLDSLYAFDYAHWCLYTHGSIFAKVADVTGIDKNQRIRSIIFCVLSAAGGMLEGVRRSKSEANSAEFEILWKTFGKLEREGVFMPQSHGLTKTETNVQEPVRRLPRHQST